MSAVKPFTRNTNLTLDLFSNALNDWGIELSDSDRTAFATYAEMLVDWNSNRFNLTRLVSPEQIALNHFLDSIVLSQLITIPAGASLIDIGTGAGFPGLAFKMLRRDIKLTLVESTAKKLGFCRAVAAETGLTQIEFVHARAEDPDTLRTYSKKATLVTARAVAPLSTLLQWTAPFIAPGGTIVAWKGSKVHDEVAEARMTADRLGLKMRIEEKSLSIPGVDPVTHYYVVCRTKD